MMFQMRQVGIDLFSLYDKEYVIGVDYNSKYVEVAQLKNERAASVIKKVKKMFSCHGIPKEVFTDNGSQFTSNDFKIFENDWDFAHDSSSPEYPKSNGFVERHIQTVKRSLKKAKETMQDPYLVILMLNTTPDKDGQSPASKMFGRHPRTLLPSIVKPKSNNPSGKLKAKHRYDKRSRDLPEIEPHTTVRIFSRSKYGNWRQKGKVLSKRKEPRSYNVLNDRGNIIRRNRWQLTPTNETFNEDENIEHDFDEIEDDDPVEIPAEDPEIGIEPEIHDYVTRSGRISRKPDRLGVND